MRVVLVAPIVIALLGLGLIVLLQDVLPVSPLLAAPLFLGFALGTILASLLVPRVVVRIATLRGAILAVALAAMVTTGATIAVATATTMIDLGPPQFVLLAIVAVMGAAFGIVVEYAVARDLSADALRLRLVAARIAAGALDARSGVERGDEIGQAARAIDTMAGRLGSLEQERADTRAARQAFLAAVGHDLRSPLSALRAALDALEDGIAPNPGVYFGAMRADIEAIRRLVDDLFLLARIEDGSLGFDRVPTDLAELADEAVEALAPIAVQKHVSVEVRAGEPAPAPVGPSEIARVIRNLLDNAIRHAPDGSRVLIELAPQEAGILVRVVDQGEGFEPASGQRLLADPGRVEPRPGRASGAGLGLVIARGLVEAHGGRFWVEDGVGGRVAFWVPATA